MSREHKYRAWDINGQVMVYSGDRWSPGGNNHPKQIVTVCNDRIIYPYAALGGAYVRVVDDSGAGHDYYPNWDYDKFFSANLIFEQYTGLKDKNGVELDWWENDLFRKGRQHSNNPIANVVYDERAAQWIIVGKSGNAHCTLAEAYMNDWYKVGNIHQQETD